MTSAEIRGTLYGKVKRYLTTTKKQVRFNVNLLVDHQQDLIKELQLWMIQQCDPDDFRPADSDVWFERYDGQQLHAPVQMGEGEFWDFVHSDRWDEYSSLRISEGALLQRLMEVYYGLRRQGRLHEFETEIMEAKTKGHTKYDMRIAFTYYGPTSGCPKQRDDDEQTTAASPKTSRHLALFRSDPMLVERSVENLVSFLSKRSMSWPSDLATTATTSGHLQNPSPSLRSQSTHLDGDNAIHTNATRSSRSPTAEFTSERQKCEGSSPQPRDSIYSTPSPDMMDSGQQSTDSLAAVSTDAFSTSYMTDSSGTSRSSFLTKESTSEIDLPFGSSSTKAKCVCFDVQSLMKPESSTTFVPARPVSPHPSKHRRQSGTKIGQPDREHCYPRLPPTFVKPRRDKPSLTVLDTSDQKDQHGAADGLRAKGKVLNIATRLKEAQRLKKTRQQAGSIDKDESTQQIPTPQDSPDVAVPPRSILRHRENTSRPPENLTAQIPAVKDEEAPPFHALNRTYSFDKLREQRQLVQEHEDASLDEDERKLPELSVLLGHYSLSRRRHLTTETKARVHQDFFPSVRQEDFTKGCLKALENFVVRKEQAVVHVGRTVVRVITTITINKVPLLKRS